MKIVLIIVLMSVLVTLAWIDFNSRLLPDIFTFSLLWLGLVANPLFQWATLYDAVLGAVLGYLFLWSAYWIFKGLRQKEGLGFGDLKLFSALGAWFGWQALPALLLCASAGTLSVLCILKSIGRYPKDPRIPLGPGLCCAGILGGLFKIFFH